MLDKTFKALDDLFDTLGREMSELFPRGKSVSVSSQGDLTVAISDGNVVIKGPVKELRINGKLVRFKEKP